MLISVMLIKKISVVSKLKDAFVHSYAYAFANYCLWEDTVFTQTYIYSYFKF